MSRHLILRNSLQIWYNSIKRKIRNIIQYDGDKCEEPPQPSQPSQASYIIVPPTEIVHHTASSRAYSIVVPPTDIVHQPSSPAAAATDYEPREPNIAEIKSCNY